MSPMASRRRVVYPGYGTDGWVSGTEIEVIFHGFEVIFHGFRSLFHAFMDVLLNLVPVY